MFSIYVINEDNTEQKIALADNLTNVKAIIIEDTTEYVLPGMEHIIGEMKDQINMAFAHYLRNLKDEFYVGHDLTVNYHIKWTNHN